MDYTDGPHMVEFFPYFGFSADARAHYADVKCGLLGDIQNDTLPDVSFVMGDEVDEDSDEGPSDLPGIGGQLVETIIRTLFASPAWKDTAVFITYDENGGIADHVVPAPACEPDSYPPHDGERQPADAGRRSTRRASASRSSSCRRTRRRTTRRTSSTITRRSRASSRRASASRRMTGRDANALPPLEMFDFQNPPFMTPPTITATTTVPPAILSQCKQVLAPLSCNSDN
jgi:phospholipase C